MSELVPVVDAPASPAPATVALRPGAPTLAELFAFADDAERRFETLRMAIRERVVTARGEETVHHEVLVRHPGRARITRRRSEDLMSRDYDVWLSDGEVVRTYDALDRLASARRRPPALVGADRARMPSRSTIRPVLTALPAGGLADTFVHPRGLLRHVVPSGPHALLGTSLVAGRESFVVRVEHPRSALVLADRPDRALVVGIDRRSGLLVLLVESFGEAVTRHAEVTSLELDGAIPDSAFRLHLGPDDRLIY